MNRSDWGEVRRSARSFLPAVFMGPGLRGPRKVVLCGAPLRRDDSFPAHSPGLAKVGGPDSLGGGAKWGWKMASGKTDHALERLVFFSDAVFAIAITLLVIEIHPPGLARGAGTSEHLAALARLIPNFVGFAISFVVIGFFWSGHHRAFTMAGRYHGGVVIWNLALLGAIAFVPFVTAFMSANYNMHVPALFYWGWIVLTALLNLRVNSIATGPAMLAEGVSGEAARAVPRRSRAVLFGAVTALLVALFAPFAAPAGMATVPLWIWLQGRARRA